MIPREKKRGNGDLPFVPKEAIREQLARIVKSQRFRTSKHCVSLLEYLTEQTLEGHIEWLKERSLGVEVFGRDSGYDTSQDPVVRFTAGEVRKRLAQYYQEPGHEQELRMDLPSGAYVPEFLPPVARPATPGPKSGRLSWVWALALVPVAAALLIGYSWRRATVVDRFWGPVLSDPGAILLSVGEVRVYGFREPRRSQMGRLAEQPYKESRPVPTPPNLVNDLLPLWGQYLGIGDSMCLARLAAFFEQRRKVYRIRGGTVTSLADLRDGPAVLIGAFTNEWTLRLTEGLRFTFQYDAEHSIGAIRDRTRPGEAGWQVPDVWPDPKMWTDYGLVSRVRHPSTGRFIVTAVGVDRCGSIAAGELLTSPDYLGEALRTAPSGWEHKNIQIVFWTPVVDENTGPPKSVALHVW